MNGLSTPLTRGQLECDLLYGGGIYMIQVWTGLCAVVKIGYSRRVLGRIGDLLDGNGWELRTGQMWQPVDEHARADVHLLSRVEARLHRRLASICQDGEGPIRKYSPLAGDGKTELYSGPWAEIHAVFRSVVIQSGEAAYIAPLCDQGLPLPVSTWISSSGAWGAVTAESTKIDRHERHALPSIQLAGDRTDLSLMARPLARENQKEEACLEEASSSLEGLHPYDLSAGSNAQIYQFLTRVDDDAKVGTTSSRLDTERDRTVGSECTFLQKM